MEEPVSDPDNSVNRLEAGDHSQERSARPARKRYSEPVLVEYGPIGKLTRSGSDTIGDPNSMMMPCL